jgi:hypothetical protein
MKRLALALVTVLAAVASDVTFAHGGAGGFHGGGHGSGGTGGFHGGGGHTAGKSAGGHGARWQGGGYSNRWRGGGWHGGWYGPGFGIYLGAYPSAWPYAYYGTYAGYDSYPVYSSDTTVVYAEPEQQVAPAYYWYFCADPRGYYPYVQNCNDEWLAVVPQR